MTRQNVTNLGMRGYRFAVLRAGARSVYETEMRVHPTELRGSRVRNGLVTCSDSV
jgi:hypothetical protein